MREYKDLNSAFVETMVELKANGNLANSRGSTQLEHIFFNMVISDPTKINVQVPARKFSQKYAVLEWLWYLSRTSKSNNIGKLAKIWLDISDENGEVESSYGIYILSQWEWIINELHNDKDSRRATIVINQPYHKFKNNKDYPCTQYLHFFIRGDYLHLGVSMRSNDAVFGFCNDVFNFCLFQQLMFNELRIQYPNLKLGSYFHHAGSFHIYEKHFPMMEKICSNYYKMVQTNGYPEIASIILKQNVTWSYIKDNKLFLPHRNMSTEEMDSFYNEKIVKLFDEYFEKS